MRAASIGSSVIFLSVCLATMPAAAQQAQAGTGGVATVPSRTTPAALQAAVSLPKAVGLPKAATTPTSSCRAESDCSRRERVLLLLGILSQGL